MFEEERLKASMNPLAACQKQSPVDIMLVGAAILAVLPCLDTREMPLRDLVILASSLQLEVKP